MRARARARRQPQGSRGGRLRRAWSTCWSRGSQACVRASARRESRDPAAGALRSRPEQRRSHRTSVAARAASPAVADRPAKSRGDSAMPWVSPSSRAMARLSASSSPPRRRLAKLDHRCGERTSRAADLELVSDLAGEVARGGQPGHRLGRIVSRERQEPDVLLRQRLPAEVAERGEVLDALLVELARGVSSPLKKARLPRLTSADESDRVAPTRRASSAAAVNSPCAASKSPCSPARIPAMLSPFARSSEGVGLRRRERRLEALPALRQVAVDLPEAANADHKA